MGEDGLAGISDDQQLLCFALALWNGKDPILKERLFGLTNSEGNHGEDVKVAVPMCLVRGGPGGLGSYSGSNGNGVHGPERATGQKARNSLAACWARAVPAWHWRNRPSSHASSWLYRWRTTTTSTRT